MGKWFRENNDFREFLLDHLSDFKKRGYVLESGIDKIIEEQINMKYNHIRIIATMVNLEIVLKQLLKVRNPR
jgi:hypothetical protein